MTEVAQLLHELAAVAGCPAAVWMQAAPDEPLVVAHGDAGLAPPDALPDDGLPAVLRRAGGEVHVGRIPGPWRGWLAVGPVCKPRVDVAAVVRLLAPVVGLQLQSAVEVDHAARELAERYEEINLLYSISEILGRTLTLEDAAGTILREISETVGAERGAILVHDRVTDTLQGVACLRTDVLALSPIAVEDAASASAHVFRTRHPLIVGSEFPPCPAEEPYRHGAMLAVPIMWTTPGGLAPLGVVNLSGRRSRQPFTAGDLKLVAAIATQIGSAIENARLVRASLSQQRLMQEMQLAHDLQMKLLPNPRLLAPLVDVAARVVPAESVGGDFYQLFRLGERRAGVMLGDVSSHGYRAALIMALAMSASAIHAQDSSDPAEVLDALLASLHEELESTEMFISLFYAVLDRRQNELRYANAGHPHAFVVRGDGRCERLSADAPPLGMVPEAPAVRSTAWGDDDLLLLFTDGITDARDRFDVRLGEEPVLELVRAERALTPQAIVDRVFALLDAHTGDVPRRDDQTLVVARA